MARLYVWVESDTGRYGKQEKTMTGNKEMTIWVNYGSVSNSKRAVYLHISFPKGQEKPTITLSNYIGEAKKFIEPRGD